MASPGCAAWRALFVLALAGMLSACASLEFYRQAAAGQFEIWRRAQPIAALLADPALAPALRARLELVEQARRFAQDELDLPSAGSYHSYADLERDYVVWNVFAAPEFDLAPHRSCFPIAGCVDYRGYFTRPAAERYAAILRTRGYDTFVGGVAAYSTLGWFADPVLNTYLSWPVDEMLELLFHELAHQRLYVADDTTFNESYASAVAAAGVARWLSQRGQGDDAPARRHARDAAVSARVAQARAALAPIYAGSAPPQAKRAAKHAVFAALEADLARLHGQADAPRPAAASAWNNARLAAVTTYNELVPAFRALFRACDEDFAAFHRAATAIGELEPAHRHAQLRALAATSRSPTCPATRMQ